MCNAFKNGSILGGLPGAIAGGVFGAGIGMVRERRDGVEPWYKFWKKKEKGREDIGDIDKSTEKLRSSKTRISHGAYEGEETPAGPESTNPPIPVMDINFDSAFIPSGNIGDFDIDRGCPLPSAFEALKKLRGLEEKIYDDYDGVETSEPSSPTSTSPDDQKHFAPVIIDENGVAVLSLSLG